MRDVDADLLGNEIVKLILDNNEPFNVDGQLNIELIPEIQQWFTRCTCIYQINLLFEYLITVQPIKLIEEAFVATGDYANILSGLPAPVYELNKVIDVSNAAAGELKDLDYELIVANTYFRFMNIDEQAKTVLWPLFGQYLKKGKALIDIYGPKLHSSTKLHLYDSANIYWSLKPGCYERHLQRKHNNPLFSIDNRSITAKDIHTARLCDLRDRQLFQKEKGKTLTGLHAKIENSKTVGEAKELWEQIWNVKRLSANMNDNVSDADVNALAVAEKSLYESLVSAVDGEELKNGFTKLRGCNVLKCFSLWAQYNREDSPFSKTNNSDDDFLRAALCESLDTIKFIAYLLGSVGLDRRTEVKVILDDAVLDGYPKDKAKASLNMFFAEQEKSLPTQGASE